MALLDFIKKQFIDVIEWTENGDDVLAWRYPMQDHEIQSGAGLTVRESQLAMFVNEGKIADVFAPGRYELRTNTLPLLTDLKNWDKLFDSPFKSDVYYFSTRQRLDQRWGTAQPVTLRDAEFGAVRVRAFGNYSFHIADPKLFHTQISGTREFYTVAELDGQLRGAPAFEAMGLKLDGFTVQSLSLPDELQKILDQRIGMGMVGGDMGKFMQYQTAQAIPKMAESAGNSGLAGGAMGIGAGVALGQVLGQNLQASLLPAASAPAAAPISADDVVATIEKLHGLKTKGILSDAEFEAKKAELLKKLV